MNEYMLCEERVPYIANKKVLSQYSEPNNNRKGRTVLLIVISVVIFITARVILDYLGYK